MVENTMTQMIYDRQQELISPPDTVHVVGCGGVGTWAAIMLALAGVRHIHLYDDDTVDESNLNRLPYSDLHIGQSKVTALMAKLADLRPDIELTTHGKFEPLLHKFGRHDRVIGAVDTMHDRKIIYNACLDAGAYYVDVGAEAHRCTVSDSPADWSLVEDRAGYFTPIWVAPAVMAAALAVSAVVYHNLLEGDTVVLDLLNVKKIGQEAASEQETQESR
jgi:hypothetical protein